MTSRNSQKKSINVGCADPSNPNDTRPTCLNLSIESRTQAKLLGERQHKSMSSIFEESVKNYYAQQSKKNK